MATKAVNEIYKPSRLELSFLEGNIDEILKDGDATIARYISIYIRKTHDGMNGVDLRKRMDQAIPKKQIAGKVRVWNNSYEIRIGCADWKTMKTVVEFLKGL